MTATQAAQARLMYDAGDHTVAQIAAMFGVSRATIYRHLDTARMTAEKRMTAGPPATLVSA